MWALLARPALVTVPTSQIGSHFVVTPPRAARLIAQFGGWEGEEEEEEEARSFLALLHDGDESEQDNEADDDEDDTTTEMMVELSKKRIQVLQSSRASAAIEGASAIEAGGTQEESVASAAAAVSPPALKDDFAAQRELLEGSFIETVERISAVLDLELSPYVSAMPNVDQVLGFSAPDSSALSWASVTTERPDYGEPDEGFRFRVNLWNAPVTGVPHLQAELGVQAEEVHLKIDFVPRAPVESAPSIADVDFEEDALSLEQDKLEDQYTASWRRWWLEAAERYYTLEARQAAARMRRLPGAERAARTGTTGSPLAVDISLPRTAASVQAAAVAYRMGFDRWLGWKRVAMDRVARQKFRDPADMNAYKCGVLCETTGARSQTARIAAYAHDSQLRADLYAKAVEALEVAQGGTLLMSRNVAAGRASHPSVAGRSAFVSMQRIGAKGCVILAEAGPADPINRWTEERVFASTDVDAPMPMPAAVLANPNEPDRGC